MGAIPNTTPLPNVPLGLSQGTFDGLLGETLLASTLDSNIIILPSLYTASLQTTNPAKKTWPELPNGPLL